MFAKALKNRFVLFGIAITLALASCGASGSSELRPATVSPRTSLTPVPTSLPPTLSPFTTPLAEMPVPSGIFTETADLGWVLYKNPIEGFALALPSSWDQVDFGTEEISNMLDKTGEKNPKLKEFLQNQARSELTGMFKFFALDFEQATRGYAANVAVASILVPYNRYTFDEYVNSNIKLTEALTSTVKPVTHTRIKIDNFDAEEIHYESTSVLKSGNVSITQVLLLSKRNFFVINLSALSDQMPSYTETFDKIIQSFKLSGPNK